METTSLDLQRLDFAAKALSGDSHAGTVRAVFTGLAVFICILALISEAPSRETNLVRVIGVVAAISALVSWLKPRLADYGWCILFVMAAVGAALTSDYSRTSAGWIARASQILLMLWFAFLFGRKVWRTTVIQRDGWKSEREIVLKWIEALNTQEMSPQVLQFNSESFWTGHFTYRMLNTGFCWVVGKFKKDKVGSIEECAVYKANDIQRVDLGQGHFGIAIRGKAVRGLKTTPEMQTRLANCLSAHS